MIANFDGEPRLETPAELCRPRLMGSEESPYTTTHEAHVLWSLYTARPMALASCHLRCCHLRKQHRKIMLGASPLEFQRDSLYRVRQCKPFQGHVRRAFQVFSEPLGYKDTAGIYLLFSTECSMWYVGKASDSGYRNLDSIIGFVARFKEHTLYMYRPGNRRYVCSLQRHSWTTLQAYQRIGMDSVERLTT